MDCKTCRYGISRPAKMRHNGTINLAHTREDITVIMKAINQHATVAEEMTTCIRCLINEVRSLYSELNSLSSTVQSLSQEVTALKQSFPENKR